MAITQNLACPENQKAWVGEKGTKFTQQSSTEEGVTIWEELDYETW